MGKLPRAKVMSSSPAVNAAAAGAAAAMQAPSPGSSSATPSPVSAQLKAAVDKHGSAHAHGATVTSANFEYLTEWVVLALSSSILVQLEKNFTVAFANTDRHSMILRTFFRQLRTVLKRHIFNPTDTVPQGSDEEIYIHNRVRTIRRHMREVFST